MGEWIAMYKKVQILKALCNPPFIASLITKKQSRCRPTKGNGLSNQRMR